MSTFDLREMVDALPGWAEEAGLVVVEAGPEPDGLTVLIRDHTMDPQGFLRLAQHAGAC
ncbi:hypothetical protein [Streptomyces sp. NPDC056682]|uniref:hypothetical protein n=1 Tax=Streptomyces sp. NPDC056682 TaxID=3345909 RepID=UPI0036B7CFEF